MSVHPGDISQAMHDLNPQIVHFSGHGTSYGELCFESEIGKVMPVSADALASLFRLMADEVKCVILNACFSELQAQSVAAHIGYVIGMNTAIGDRAAIAFAVGFYKALGAGRTIPEAYEFGIVELKLLGIPEHLTPVLMSNDQPGPKRDLPEGDFYTYLKASRIHSIDNDRRLRNLNRGYWVYDEFISVLLNSGWIRFAAGFKAGMYAHPKQHWCIKLLGMGVGDNPPFFCERGYYLEHERNLLTDFSDAGFSFQPRAMTRDEAISFLIGECDVTEEQATMRSRNNDVLITEFFPGIPLLTQTGQRLECEFDPHIMSDDALRSIGLALESLKLQLDRANNQGLLHNDPIGFNIVLTPGPGGEVAAKLIDFELAQNSKRQSPDYVNNSVEELYRERNVPFNTQTGRYTKNLDQHLMGESIQIVEQLAAKLQKYRDQTLPFHSLSLIGPFSSGIEIKLENVAVTVLG